LFFDLFLFLFFATSDLINLVHVDDIIDYLSRHSEKNSIEGDEALSKATNARRAAGANLMEQVRNTQDTMLARGILDASRYKRKQLVEVVASDEDDDYSDPEESGDGRAPNPSTPPPKQPPSRAPMAQNGTGAQVGAHVGAVPNSALLNASFDAAGQYTVISSTPLAVMDYENRKLHYLVRVDKGTIFKYLVDRNKDPVTVSLKYLLPGPSPGELMDMGLGGMQVTSAALCGFVVSVKLPSWVDLSTPPTRFETDHFKGITFTTTVGATQNNNNASYEG
jgi:hypothetical protein